LGRIHVRKVAADADMTLHDQRDDPRQARQA
jgi:hypothetical protein